MHGDADWGKTADFRSGQCIGSPIASRETAPDEYCLSYQVRSKLEQSSRLCPRSRTTTHRASTGRRDGESDDKMIGESHAFCSQSGGIWGNIMQLM